MRGSALIISGLVILSCQKKASFDDVTVQPEDAWAFPHFVKVDSLNPILKPSPDLTFTDPITAKTVQWEERNVLNPTAVVKNDTVFLLYRAQDSLGTSRIGMAISTDGLNFEKLAEPVFYPDNDAMKVFEWNYKKIDAPQENAEDCYFCYFDGVEDPRIVQSEAGELTAISGTPG